MVQLSLRVCCKVGHGKRRFIDKLRIFVQGGNGGNGLPRYGGLGGNGGQVFAVAKKDQTFEKLLQSYPLKRIRAAAGKDSRKTCIVGTSGEDKYIEVPVGVSVLNEHGRLLADLDEEEKTVLIAEGGAGGSIHTQFCGQRGQAHNIVLDLKIIADVGLIGFPNAGKSSLLKAVSRASPKIASYPFTTLNPQLGILQYDDFRRISMADLPGLIEGAHYNVGMGHKFLKHLERTKLHLFIVDINGFQLSYKYPWRSAFETILLLNKEVELYREDLLQKPSVLAINKIDTDKGEENLKPLLEKLKNISDYLQEIPEELHPKQTIQFDDVIAISAKKGNGIEHLRERIRRLLDFYATIEIDKQIQSM